MSLSDHAYLDLSNTITTRCDFRTHQHPRNLPGVFQQARQLASALRHMKRCGKHMTA
jgi:hypothetical protein